MDTQKVVEQLRNKFEGVSDAVLKPTATKLARTIEDETALQEEIAGVTIQSIIESYTDNRVTTGVNTALRRERAKTSQRQEVEHRGTDDDSTEEEEKKDATQEQKRTPADATTKLLQQLTERLAALEGMQAKSTSAARADELRELTATLPKSIAAAITDRPDLDRLSEEQFATLKEDTRKRVEEIAKDVAKPLFQTPLHTTQAPSDPAVKESAERIAKEFASEIKAK